MAQVLDKNTVKLVAGEYDLLVVDKEEAGVTDAAKKTSEWLDVEDLDDAVPRPPVVRAGGRGLGARVWACGRARVRGGREVLAAGRRRREAASSGGVTSPFHPPPPPRPRPPCAR